MWKYLIYEQGRTLSHSASAATGAKTAAHALERIFAGVIHRGGRGHRRRVEILYLVGAEAVALQPQREIYHVFVGRMASS
jgi:hypothetical protein